MKKRLQALLARAHSALSVRPDPESLSIIQSQNQLLNEAARREQAYRQDYIERAAELIEAKQMSGAGPWLVSESRGDAAQGRKLRESNPITSQGAYSDIELALQNVEWRRQVNLSWLEFSRWGIQQIMLISRLYYIKNPLIRRLIDVCAAYVFARGVEVSSTDDVANEVLDRFFERNQKVLGHMALVDLERRKDYDGNLFFCFFSDTQSTGDVSVRTIDATEVMDIVCDPNDTDTPWYYRRSWTERVFDEKSGTLSTVSREAWYPALGFEPSAKPDSIASISVEWDHPVYHRKCGGVAKWHFGCPRIYPAVDWARTAKDFLTACATVRQSLAQFSMLLTTKGGQQAMEGVKQQWGTTVGPSSALWDTNPTAVNASVFASGPGTTLAAFNTKGAGGDPEEVRQYKLMCAMVKGVPETFLADVSTGNLATATSLDRPTETVFLELQEAWIEDLNIIGAYVLRVSAGATAGAIRESRPGFKIREGKRIRMKDGRMGYDAADPEEGIIDVRTNFPAIREGDIPTLVEATVKAITLGNKQGTANGIDLKCGVQKLFDLLGVEDADEITEEMFPEATYKVERDPPLPPEPPPADGTSVKPTEAHVRKLARRLIDAVEGEKNGNHPHVHGG